MILDYCSDVSRFNVIFYTLLYNGVKCDYSDLFRFMAVTVWTLSGFVPRISILGKILVNMVHTSMYAYVHGTNWYVPVELHAHFLENRKVF
jgi:hypothetical protein